MAPSPALYELRTIGPHDDKYMGREGDEDGSFSSSMQRASLDSTQSYELYTPDEDRTVLNRLDRRLVYFMALLYSLSFLDRSSESFRQMYARA